MIRVGIETTVWADLVQELGEVRSERDLLLAETRRLLDALDDGRITLSNSIRAFVLETRLRGIVTVIDAKEKR